MVKALEEVISDSWNWKSGDRFLANKLLMVIENKGMLPPNDRYTNSCDEELRKYYNKWDEEENESR